MNSYHILLPLFTNSLLSAGSPGNLLDLLKTFIWKKNKSKQQQKFPEEKICYKLPGLTSQSLNLFLTQLIQLCLKFHLPCKTCMHYAANGLLAWSVLRWVSPVHVLSSPGAELSAYWDVSIPQNSLKDISELWDTVHRKMYFPHALSIYFP